MKTKILKHITIGAAIGLSAIAMQSCSDELDKFNTQETANEEYWQNEVDAKLALVGAYIFQTGWSHDAFDSFQGMLYLDLAGGNGTEKENFTTNIISVH